MSFEEYIQGYKDFLRLFEFKDEIDLQKMYRRYLVLKKENKNENQNE